MPKRSTGRSLDAEATDKPADVILPATGPLPPSEGTIERVSDMSNIGNKAKELAFMEERLDIRIHETSDPNAEQMVFVSVNGEGGGPHKLPWLPRGQVITVKRKIVERLARSKRIGVRTQEVTDGNGNRTTAIRRSSSLGYDFSVLRDPNPHGAEWLKRVLAEA
jgi:hypothetical protein